MFLGSISGGDPVKIFTFVGKPGDNGKSTYLSFLCSLISYQGVMEMSITNLVKGTQ